MGQTFPLRVDGDITLPMNLSEPENLTPRMGYIVRVLENGSYRAMSDKPCILGNTLEGDKSFLDLGLDEITPSEIDDIIFGGLEP